MPGRAVEPAIDSEVPGREVGTTDDDAADADDDDAAAALRADCARERARRTGDTGRVEM